MEKPVEDKQQQSIVEKDPDEEMPICGFTLSRVPWQQGRDGADAEKQVETDDIDEAVSYTHLTLPTILLV